MSEQYTLHYWGIRARNWPTLAIAHYGDVHLEWNRNPDDAFYKANSPFGQLPLLVGPNGFVLGQSMAIARWVARRANLQGDTDEEFAKSEMLIEEANDINSTLGQAHYNPDRKAAMDKVFNETLPKHFAALERLTNEGDKVLAGNLVIFALLDICQRLQPDCLDNYPKLKNFFQTLASHEKLKPLINDETVGMYYQRQ